MYSAVEVTRSTLFVIDHAAKIIETLVTYISTVPRRSFGHALARMFRLPSNNYSLIFLQDYRRQQVGATMLSTKYRIHESNLNLIEMNSGGMPLYVYKLEKK